MITVKTLDPEKISIDYIVSEPTNTLSIGYTYDKKHGPQFDRQIIQDIPEDALCKQNKKDELWINEIWTGEEFIGATATFPYCSECPAYDNCLGSSMKKILSGVRLE